VEKNVSISRNFLDYTKTIKCEPHAYSYIPTLDKVVCSSTDALFVSSSARIIVSCNGLGWKGPSKII